MEKLCSCGKPIPQQYNSMLRHKLCPNCELKKYKQTRTTKTQLPKAKTVKRKRWANWRDRPLPELIQHVQDRICNPYIRFRDDTKYGRCISCLGRISQAGHRFPVGTNGKMRFMVNNIHGQEISCNHFKSGNLDEYDKGLIRRHGQKYLDTLKATFLNYRNLRKFDRYNVVLIGETYKYLHENKILVFDQEVFDDYKLKLLEK
jgi:hypothetical protein